MALHQQIHASAELRLVLDTALDAVVVMTADGIIAEWNDRAVEVFGWSREEAVGYTMADRIIPPEFRAAHYRGLRAFLDTGEGPILGRRIEVVGMRKSGETFPVELSVSPVHDRHGVVFVGCLRDISERKRAEDQQKRLVAEFDHRVKNMLSVVSGIASQTARTSGSIDEFSEKFLERLQAMGRAHSMLTARNWGATLLSDLFGEIIVPYAPADRAQLAFAGPPVSINANTTLTLNLILHELVTNATKYGALSSPSGAVSVRWQVHPGSPPQLELTWHESGLANIAAPARTGFGAKLIEASTRHDLGGRVAVTYRPDGVRYEFQFPLL